MKHKKIFAGLVTLSATLLLGACGNGSTTDGSASAGKENKKDTAKMTEEELAKEDRVKEATIEVYAPAGKNTDYLLKSVEFYNEEFGTNLSLKTVDVAPAVPMVQKITPKLVANEKMPDLIFLQDANAGSVFDKFEDRFYSSEKFGFVKEHGEEFYAAKMNMLSNIAPSKVTFGFPNDWGNAAMYYNKAIFDNAGVDIEKDVKTWDDLIEAGKKNKELTGKNLLFMRDTGELDLVKYITEQQGVSMFDREGNLNLLQPEVETAYEIIKKLQDADLVEYGNADDYSKIGQELGLIFAGGWLASYQVADFPDENGDWRIAPMIEVPGAAHTYAPMSGGSSYYVPKKSDNALAALQFISYALTNEKALDAYMDLNGLPANMKAYDSDVAKKEVEYYGNQQILQTLNEISKNSIEGYVFPYSAELNSYIEAASFDMKKNNTPAKEALQKQADEFASKFGVKIN